MAAQAAVQATCLGATPETMTSTASSAVGAADAANQPSILRRTGVMQRWLARLIAARERRAAIQVLRHLDDRIPHATEPYRAHMVAVAEGLRRALR